MPTSTASTSARSRCRCVKPGRTVDVFGVPGDRRDPAVDRLADLPDHDEVIDRPPAQRTEPGFPRLGQGFQRGSKFAWNREPVVGVTTGVIRLALMSHVFARAFTRNGKMRATNFMIFGD